MTGSGPHDHCSREPFLRQLSSGPGGARAEEVRWRDAVATLEFAGEVGGALEADVGGDLVRARAALEEQRAGAFEADLADEAHRADASDRGEAVGVVGRAHGGTLRELLDGELASVLLVDEPHGFEDALRVGCARNAAAD